MQERTPRRQHAGDVAERQRQFHVIEVRKDVRRDDEIECGSMETLGHDVETLSAQGAGGRLADSHGLAQTAVRALDVGGVSDGASEAREILNVLRRELHVRVLSNAADQRQRRRLGARAPQMIHDPRVDVRSHHLEIVGA